MDSRSKHLRRLILRGMRSGKRGHWGSASSLVEILRVLYDDIKKTKDKVILSKGHGCLALYAILVDKGLIPIEELDRFCQKDGMLGGHPAPHIPGVECHTGALGHGLGIGVGMAIAAKIRKKSCRIFVIVGDGECNEGSIWEAAMSASKYKLNNLTVIVDRNGLQSAGFTEIIQPMESMKAKWEAFGFNCYECNGHDVEKLKSELSVHYQRSLCIIANTVKGYGISYLENNKDKHYLSKLTEEYFTKMETALEAA